MKTETELRNPVGSAPAPGAVFRAHAENRGSPENARRPNTSASSPEAERAARSATPGAGVLPDWGFPTVSNPCFIWIAVAVFAIAFAWVESAVVFYIRTHVDRLEPYQPAPLPLIGELGPVELVRELATMIMLLTAGALAGRTWRTRWGYAVFAFGIWDICYYVFLKVMCDWPKSLLDWDILFLIPLPWWGPVLAPVLIAALMILWGTCVTQFEHTPPPALSKQRVWLLGSIGIVLALYVFMADALRVADQGVAVIRNVLPVEFNWPVFTVALLLMAAPVVRELPVRWVRREIVSGTPEPN